MPAPRQRRSRSTVKRVYSGTAELNLIAGSFLGCLAVLVIAVGFAIAAEGDRENAVLMEKEYCAMVELFKESKGQQGWPDFKHNYEDVCY